MKKIAALLCHFTILIATIVCMIIFFAKSVTHGFAQFRYFTIDSNIFCAVICGISIVHDIRSLKNVDYEQPEWLRLLKFISTVSVVVTFTTVMAFLGPTQGYGKMLHGTNLILHLINPVLAALSLMVFERKGRLPGKTRVLGLAPTIIYGTVYLILAVFVGKANGGWSDFYGFNEGGMWYAAFGAMVAGTGLISFLLGL